MDGEQQPDALREYEEHAESGADGQEYVDRDVIDFDPADGLYSGTAVDGTSEIPGPHESGDDVESDAASDPENPST